jgi:hypothetical protein|tara:strand:+ start:390 stop:608 length:219 start_codon:yes stop_codon:yes gene_type:complete
MNKYQPKYEHDFAKLDPEQLFKRPTDNQKKQFALYRKYNAYYLKLMSGDRSSEVLKMLDTIQDKINEAIDNK